MICLIALYRPDSEDVVLAAGGHIFTISSEFDHPDGAIIILKLNGLLQGKIVELVVCLLVELCSDPVIGLLLKVELLWTRGWRPQTW